MRGALSQYIPFTVGALLDADKLLKKVLDHRTSLLRSDGVLDARHKTLQSTGGLRFPNDSLNVVVSLRDQVLLVLLLAAGTVGILSLLAPFLLTQGVDNCCLVHQSVLQQSQFAGVDINLCSGHLEAMAVSTLRAK